MFSERVCTGCAQFILMSESGLCIECIPYRRYLFADHKVEFDGFIDLVDRVDGGSMVFAAKFVSNSRETEVKLTSHQIHGDLAR